MDYSDWSSKIRCGKYLGICDAQNGGRDSHAEQDRHANQGVLTAVRSWAPRPGWLRRVQVISPRPLSTEGSDTVDPLGSNFTRMLDHSSSMFILQSGRLFACAVHSAGAGGHRLDWREQEGGCAGDESESELPQRLACVGE